MTPMALLSKIVAIIMFAISFIIPASPDKMDINVNVVSDDGQKIVVEWQNRTGKAITLPVYYLEKQVKGEWLQVEFSEGFGFPEMAATYYPTEKGNFTVITERDLNEPLSEGTYRITLCYRLLYCDTPDGSSSAVFNI